MEDALALAACLNETRWDPEALAAYEAERRPVVASTQRAAQASLEWFETLGRTPARSRSQFAFNLLTRSRRVTYDNLRLRDPEFVAAIDSWFAGTRSAAAGAGEVLPPMFQPFRLRGLKLTNRVVVSPMDMYSAPDGMPDDFHLVHLGEGARRGRAGDDRDGLRSAAGRITPGCTGLYEDGARGRLAADRRLRPQLGVRPRSGCSSAIPGARARPG